MFSSPAVSLSLTSELLATTVHRLNSCLNEYILFCCLSASETSRSSSCSCAMSPSISRISVLPLLFRTNYMQSVKDDVHSFSLYFVAPWVNSLYVSLNLSVFSLRVLVVSLITSFSSTSLALPSVIHLFVTVTYSTRSVLKS